MGTPQWAEIARTEQIVGWLALIFALTMAIGNPKNILWRIAEHSLNRSGWVVVFGIVGLGLILAPRLLGRRYHLLLCTVAFFFWGFFAAQAYNVEAYGASMMGIMSAVYMGLIAATLYRGDGNA